MEPISLALLGVAVVVVILVAVHLVSQVASAAGRACLRRQPMEPRKSAVPDAGRRHADGGHPLHAALDRASRALDQHRACRVGAHRHEAAVRGCVHRDERRPERDPVPRTPQRRRDRDQAPDRAVPDRLLPDRLPAGDCPGLASKGDCPAEWAPRSAAMGTVPTQGLGDKTRKGPRGCGSGRLTSTGCRETAHGPIAQP